MKDSKSLMDALLNSMDSMNTSEDPYAWSANEIEILKEYYPKLGVDVVSRLPGRSISAIRGMVYKLGLCPKPKEREKNNTTSRSGSGCVASIREAPKAEYPYDEYEIGRHRFSKGRYLYDNDYPINPNRNGLHGQDGRIYKRTLHGRDMYYLCVCNSAIDWDDWHFGDALIPVAVDIVNSKIDIIKTCDKKYMDSLREDGAVIVLSLCLDVDYCEPTEFMICEADMKEFKESCWFRDVAFDYEENGTRIDSFVVDHKIPYAEAHPEYKEIQLYVADIPYELTWRGMVDRFNREGHAGLSI